MTRKIIIYNSFAHDANPHATLLRRQLSEVNNELLSCPARDRKTLVNERRLLQRKLRIQDTAGDVVGTPEEVAYGEGWHSQLKRSPYDDPNLTKAWERGKTACAQMQKLRGNSYKGGVRGQRLEAPKAKAHQDA